MKNCTLFDTEEKLREVWERRKLITKEDDSLFVKWACFWEADVALQDKFMTGRLLKHKGRYVVSVGVENNRCGNAFFSVNCISAEGSVSSILAAELEESDYPQCIIDLAKAVVIEEMKAKCPMLAKEK